MNNSTCNCYAPLFSCLERAKCHSNGNLWNSTLDACLDECDPVLHCGIELALNNGAANNNGDIFAFATSALVIVFVNSI
jgi:hypothetical protein